MGAIIKLDPTRCHYPNKDEEQCQNPWLHYAAGMKLCTTHLAMFHEWANGDQVVFKRTK